MGMIVLIYQALKNKIIPYKNKRIPVPMVMGGDEESSEYASAGDDSYFTVLYDVMLDKIAQVAPEAGKALDIACGPANLLCLMAKEHPRLEFTGIELSDSMIKIAKANAAKGNISNLKIKKMDMFKIEKLGKVKFDFISWNLTTHHCENDEQVLSVINQAVRLLSEKGVFFIYDLNRMKSESLVNWYLKEFCSDGGPQYFKTSSQCHRAAFGFGELEALFKKSEWKNYVHKEPVLFNSFQYAYSSVKLKKVKKHNNLSGERKRIYKLLSFLTP